MTEAKTSPKPAKDTIYIDVEDDITSIISKVEASGSKEIALVLPKRAVVLQSIVNMRLLARSAKNANKKVVLVTSESALMPLAGAAGLPVAKSLEASAHVPSQPEAATPSPSTPADPDQEMPAKIDYERPIGELAASYSNDASEAIALADDDESKTDKTPVKPPKNKKLKVPNFDRFRLLLGLGILGLIALITFIIFAIFVLPKATIAIQTTSTPFSGNFNLTTSDTAKELDKGQGIIPVQLKKSDQTAKKDIQATGQQNLGKKATGAVNMTYQVCGTIQPPSSVPAGTGLTTKGLTFITQENTSFSSSGTVSDSCINYPSTSSTDIVAQQGGSAYNVGANSSFAVVGYSNVSATNPSALSGGTDNNVTVLSQQDVDKVKEEITSAASDKFSQDFQKSLSDEGFFVIIPTLKISDAEVTATPAVGQQTSTANVTVKVSYSVLVVTKDHLKEAITHNLKNQIDQDNQQLSGNVLEDVNITVQSQSSPTVAVLAIGVETDVLPNIDKNAVEKQVMGQKSGYIKSTIGVIPGVTKVDVHLSPFWVSKVPKKASKVTVTVTADKTAAADEPR
ncbi:MAG: hypothetical protein WD877_01660 [Candidatus Saccharimonadales bacterium]